MQSFFVARTSASHAAKGLTTRLAVSTMLIASSMACAIASDVSPSSPAQQERRRIEPAAIARSVRARSTSADDVARSSHCLDLSPAVIHKAIADTDDFVPLPSAGHVAQFGTGGASPRQRIDQKVKDADIPTCMTMDAWKFEQPHIGPIGIVGPLALPWLIHVIATGKCRN
jgi:hypothetical protein